MIWARIDRRSGQLEVRKKVHITTKLGSTALVLAVLGGRSVVHADGINFLDQSRTVAVVAWVSEDLLEDVQTESDGAPDFAPFDSMVSVDATVPGAQAHAEASQFSEILPFAVSGSLSTNASAVRDPGGFVRRSEAASGFRVTFQLDKPVPYTLEATGQGVLSRAFIFAAVELTGPSGDIVFFDASWGGATLLVNGLLDPGEYVFRAASVVGIGTIDEGQTEGSSAVTFELVLPEPSTVCLLGFGAWIALRRRR